MTGDTLSLLSLLGMVAVLLLVLGACWLFTRWAGTGLAGRFGVPADRRQMKVVERLAVGRDQALLVVQLAGRTFLIGSSPSGFSLLAELTEEELSAPSSDGVPPEPPDFRALLRNFRAKK